MTDTSSKTRQSCTVSDTPETDAEVNECKNSTTYNMVWAEFARKLERERDEARELVKNLEASLTAAIRSANARQKETEEALFDLAFRRDLYKLQENQLDEMRKQLAEAVSSCHIWQSGHSELVDDRNRWMSLASVRREEYLQAVTLVNDLNKEIAILRKQNAEQLTILQEHGLAEYGN